MGQVEPVGGSGVGEELILELEEGVEAGGEVGDEDERVVAVDLLLEFLDDWEDQGEE